MILSLIFQGTEDDVTPNIAESVHPPGMLFPWSKRGEDDTTFNIAGVYTPPVMLFLISTWERMILLRYLRGYKHSFDMVPNIQAGSGWYSSLHWRGWTPVYDTARNVYRGRWHYSQNLKHAVCPSWILKHRNRYNTSSRGEGLPWLSHCILYLVRRGWFGDQYPGS